MNLSDIISGLSEGHITAGGGLVIVGFIILGVFRGIMRVALGIAGFIAAAVAFWLCFRHGDSILSNFTDNPEPWMPLGLAGGGAVAAYTVIRHGAGLILTPLIGSIDELKKHRVLSGIAGLGLGGLGLYSGGNASHQFDAMNFLNNVQEKQESGWIGTLLSKTQESWFGNFQQKTDPTKTAYRCDLIKALSMYTSGQTQKFDQETLKPLLANQDFLKLAASPEIAQDLGATDFQSLFAHEGLKSFIQNDKNRELLQGIDWRKL